MTPNPRRDALRQYFKVLISDLTARGKIRRERGQSLDDVITSEAATLLGEVRSDLAQVGLEIGMGAVAAARSALGEVAQRGIDRAVGAALGGIANLFGNAGRKR